MSKILLPSELEKLAILKESFRSNVQNFLEYDAAALSDSACKTLLDSTLSTAGVTLYPLIEASHSSRLTENYTLYSDSSFLGTNHPTEPTGYRSFVTPTGKPMLKDHDRWSVDSVAGRIVVASCKKRKMEDGNTPRANKKYPGNWEGGYALFVIPAISDAEHVQNLLSKKYLSVSVGLRAHQIIDSISKKDILQLMQQGMSIPHYKGMEYPVDSDKKKTQLCYYIIPSWSGIECSFVNAPADESAMVKDVDLGEARVRMLLAQKKVGEDSFEMLDAKTGEVVKELCDDNEIAWDATHNFKDSTFKDKKYWDSYDLSGIAAEANIILNSLDSYGNKKMLNYEEVEKILKESYTEEEAAAYLGQIKDKFDNLEEAAMEEMLGQFAENSTEFIQKIVSDFSNSDSNTSDKPLTWFDSYQASDDKESLLTALNESVQSLGVKVDGEGNVTLSGLKIKGTDIIETFDSEENLKFAIDTLALEVEPLSIKESEDVMKDCAEYSAKYAQEYTAIKALYTSNDSSSNYLAQLVAICRTRGITQSDAAEASKPYAIFGDSVLLKLLSTVQPKAEDSQEPPAPTPLSPVTNPVEDDSKKTSSNPFGLMGIKNRSTRKEKTSS